MKFKEIEFKYRADNISLKDFQIFCMSRNPLKFVQAAGYDHFYQNAKDEDSFFRHRVGPDMNQLTFKRKTSDKNNFIRGEININLKKTAQEDVQALCKELDFKHNVSIYKACWVYVYEWYTLVYYTCYDLEQKETGRFVEIEMSEDGKWETEAQAYNELVIVEKLCASELGISPQARIKKSLFEIFKKD